MAGSVIVVGAGLAGLTVTERLQRDGWQVTLLEAGRRAGGRVRTVRSPFVDGQHVESGAEWVDTTHERMRRLLERFGTALEGEGQQWTTIRRWLHRDGRLLAPPDLHAADPHLRSELDAFEEVVQAAAAGIANPARPQDHPDAAAIDARSLRDVADEARLGAVARLFTDRDSQGEFAAEPSEVSLLFVAQQRAQQAAAGADGVVRAHRVVGGLDRVTHGLAESIGPALQLGRAVTRVEHDDHGVVVHADGEGDAMPADHVVLACPLVPLRAVRFDPALSAPLAAAVHELGYGTVTKTALQFPRRGWVSGYATTETVVQRIYEPTVDQPGQAGILMAYTGGANGRRLAELSEAERLALVAREVAMVHPGAGAPLGGFSRAWSAEPHFGGSYAVYGPGQVTAHWDVLRRPHGRVWFAGEHAATWTGYLEGAVESGERIAEAILSSR